MGGVFSLPLQVPPTLESHARELLGLPPDWRVYRWTVKGRGVEVEGAVCNAFITRGKWKGRTNWKKKDLNTLITITIPDALHKQWMREWESRTGLCHNCSGTGEEWAGWSAAEGTKRRPCRPCGASGLKSEGIAA
jgi:DnaJ-class molecular chaperone